MTEAVGLEQDAAARKEAEAETFNDFRAGEAGEGAPADEEHDDGGDAEAGEASEAGVEPGVHPGDELCLNNAERFYERKAERPEDGGEGEHPHGAEVRGLSGSGWTVGRRIDDDSVVISAFSRVVI